MYKVAAKIEGEQILWEAGCPVILEAVQVSRDAEEGAAYLQARVKNVGARPVEYLCIDTAFALSDGDSIDGTFEYFDISVKPGESVALPAKPVE